MENGSRSDMQTNAGQEESKRREGIDGDGEGSTRGSLIERGSLVADSELDAVQARSSPKQGVVPKLDVQSSILLYSREQTGETCPASCDKELKLLGCTSCLWLKHRVLSMTKRPMRRADIWELNVWHKAGLPWDVNRSKGPIGKLEIVVAGARNLPQVLP